MLLVRWFGGTYRLSMITVHFRSLHALPGVCTHITTVSCTPARVLAVSSAMAPYVSEEQVLGLLASSVAINSSKLNRPQFIGINMLLRVLDHGGTVAVGSRMYPPQRSNVCVFSCLCASVFLAVASRRTALDAS